MRLLLVALSVSALLFVGCKEKAETKEKEKPDTTTETTLGSEGQKVKMIRNVQQVKTEVESALQKGVDRRDRLIDSQ